MAETPHSSKRDAGHGLPAALPLAGMNPVPGASLNADTSTAADRSLAGISLIKGHERWQFRWDAGDEATLINRIAELARDPEIPFDWYDAAVVCKHIAQPFGSLKL